MEAVFTGILNMSASSAIVILAVIAVRFLLGLCRAPKKWSFLLWTAAAFRLLCPISFKAAFSIFEVSAIKPVSAPIVVRAPAEVEAAQSAATPDPVYIGGGSGAGETAAALSQDPMQTLLSAGAAIWLIGVIAMMIYAAVSYTRLWRKMRGAQLTEDGVYAADGVSTPFILGFARPRIYVPLGLSKDVLQYVLEHERYHIKRGDHIIKIIAFIILGVHWFNPLVWLAFCLMSRDMEMSCDEKVLSGNMNIKKDYSMALLSFAVRERFPAASPLAFGETGVKGRIKNALSFKKPKAWMTLLAAVLCIAAVAACAADPKAEDGEYDDIERYVMSVISTDTAEYPSISGEMKTANVTDVKTEGLEKLGELSGLSPQGTLEAWRYEKYVKLDAPKGDVALVGGMSESDGWYDLEGQGGHIIIALLRGDGSYDILSDKPVNDGGDFFGMHESVEESLYDWYVKEYALDLPLYIKTEDVKGLNGETRQFALRRCDGDGWYVYIPVQSWDLTESDGESAVFISLYGTGSKFRINKVTLEQEPEYPTETYISGREVRTVRSSDGGVWIVRGTYDPETINALQSEYNSIGFEPELIRIMADSFTADESFKRKTPETPEEALSEAIALTENKSTHVSLWLDHADKRETAAYSGRGVPNEAQLSTSLSDFEYAKTDEPDKSRDCVMLSVSGYRMKFMQGENTLVLYTPEGGTYAFDAEYKYREDSRNIKLGTLMRSWYDEAEFKAFGGFYDEQYNILVADRGQTHLQAAEEFCRIFESRHTEVSDGSQFKYSFVKCEVSEAAEETKHFRSLGKLDDNTWAFYVVVAFVPENERALWESMAGNTGEYTGNDPKVPYGAYEYGRCGYVTRASDGWHIELVGTGW
ncbi:MAG: hypothetical protein IJG50_05905 [Clostridia bacterium]|nr:hypothetical protein [Clostridia bacterium]